MTTCRRVGDVRWYQSSSTDAPLARFVYDLISGELARLRPGGIGSLPPPPWSAHTAIDEQGLGLDSLERLSVAAALSEALHLHESGLEDLLLARRRFGEWVDVIAQSLAAFDRQVTFRTSGSSGRPRPCSHTLEHLEREVDHWIDVLRGAGRILCAVPSHHVYGFIFTLLLPARWPEVQIVDVRRRTAPSLARDLRAGDVVIGHPDFWALVMRHVDGLTPGVVGVTSTAPCPADVADGLHSAGLSRLWQIYGSSETAGLGWRSSSTEPYRLMPHWERIDFLAGADDRPRLRWMPHDADEASDPRLHELPDQVEWIDESRFQVLGRRDSAVQVGGINVFPEHVRRVLRDHPGVADAAVRPMAAHEGNRLKAFIVWREDETPPANDRLASLNDWVSLKLTAPERPRAFEFGNALPRNAMGKLTDWSITEPDIGSTVSQTALPSAFAHNI